MRLTSPLAPPQNNKVQRTKRGMNEASPPILAFAGPQNVVRLTPR